MTRKRKLTTTTVRGGEVPQDKFNPAWRFNTLEAKGLTVSRSCSKNNHEDGWYTKLSERDRTALKTLVMKSAMARIKAVVHGRLFLRCDGKASRPVTYAASLPHFKRCFQGV